MYGYNDHIMRMSLWSEINELSGHINGLWAVMWDFNCVLNRDERIGNQTEMKE